MIKNKLFRVIELSVIAVTLLFSTLSFADSEKMETIEIYGTRLDGSSCGSYCTIVAGVDGNLQPEDMVLDVGWTDPGSPRCRQESEVAQAFSRDFAAFLNSPQYAYGLPPGRVIKFGPFDDPAFPGPGWNKYDYASILRDTVGGITTRYSIHIHYMYNTNTGTLAQVRFKSSFQAACTGTTSQAGA